MKLKIIITGTIHNIKIDAYRATSDLQDTMQKNILDTRIVASNRVTWLFKMLTFQIYFSPQIQYSRYTRIVLYTKNCLFIHLVPFSFFFLHIFCTSDRYIPFLPEGITFLWKLFSYNCTHKMQTGYWFVIIFKCCFCCIFLN